MSDENFETKSSNNIGEAYIRALKNYFYFQGRTSRYDYWGFQVVDAFAIISLNILLLCLPQFASFVILISKAYNILVILPRLSALTRRLHDTGKGAVKWIILPILYFFLLAIALSTVTEKQMILVFVSTGITILSLILFVCLCKRGSEQTNKYGPTVTEDVAQQRKGLIMPIILFFMPFVGVLLAGAMSGYTNARLTYEANKISLKMYDLLAEAKGLRGSPALASENSDDWNAGKLTEIFEANPSDGEIRVKRSGDFFVVTHSNISESMCQILSARNWQENKYFVDMKINENANCESCTAEHPCTLTWTYK